ncbi:MAG: aminotransferase class V-fold PLP-dependent enzyme [Planctomycetota bacterium]|nr:MAG: aminotransferase class V-fold PLP-dependent enzyme [Planctomycetota bacterium]
MTTTRRSFLGAAGAFAAAPLAAFAPGRPPRWLADLAAAPGSPADLAGDEDFWAGVARAYTVDRSVVNLNNGGVSPAPDMVQEVMKRHLDFSNELPPHHLWRILEPRKEGVRQRLARHWGVDPEEIALTRNASESLQILQFGLDLKSGDEVLTTTQDYPRMLNTFRQRERREGIRLSLIRIPVPAEDDDEVVRRFAAAITPRTRAILMCHVINLTGQILPVARVAALARERGIPLLVDGAHAFAHFAFKLSDLGCDFYATSLHKWLCAPHGTGLLYVRRKRIPEVWPLMAAAAEQREDIRKFEEIGTHPAANTLAVGEALTFHQLIGDERKEARLRWLRDRWAAAVREHPKVRLHTSLDPRFSCGIATVEIEGIEPAALNAWLWRKHRILCTPIGHEEVRGVRVSPHVYTLKQEIDRFADALLAAADHGIDD